MRQAAPGKIVHGAEYIMTLRPRSPVALIGWSLVMLGLLLAVLVGVAIG
jgi:hypothetical protein